MKLPCFLFCRFIYKGFVEGEWKSKEAAVFTFLSRAAGKLFAYSREGRELRLLMYGMSAYLPRSALPLT